MRIELTPPGTGELTYEIRNIVNVAEKLQKHGVKINWVSLILCLIIRFAPNVK